MNRDTRSQCMRRRAGRGRSVTVRRAAVAALASAVLAGCGSTVQVQSAGPLGQDALGQDGLGAPLSSDPGLGGSDTAAVTGSDGAGGALPQGAPGTAQGGGSTTSSGANGQAPAAAGGSGGGGGGTSAGQTGASSQAPVRIGVITQPQLEGAAKSLGLDGVTTGDTKKQVDAVVSWIRANGGLAGRRIQVLEHAVDLSDGSNDAIQNKACVAMAEDLKVHFVVTVLGSLRTLTSCLAKHGIGVLADNATVDDKFRARYEATLASPSETAPGRLMTMLVDHLVQRGWLTKASKIGIMARDNTDGHAVVEQYLKPALRRQGLQEVITEYVDDQKGDGGSNQSASAVLRFRSQGVDRFIPAFYSPVYFMIAAERQGYRPAYTVSSNDGPGALVESLAPPNQLENAVGMGWQPYMDIGKGKKPGPVSARETLCFQLMQKAGQGANSTLVKGFQVQICDLLFYLKELSDRKPDLPRDLLTSGRKALGSTYVSPATYRVDVSKRTDGMAGFRPLAYLESCECFQYVGGVVATS